MKGITAVLLMTSPATDTVAAADSRTPAPRVGPLHAFYLMDIKTENTNIAVKGWYWASQVDARMGNDSLRTAFARSFIKREPAGYPAVLNGRNKDKGQAPPGGRKYLLRLQTYQWPAAEAFWSILIYDVSERVAKLLGGHIIGERPPEPVINPHESLAIFVQNEAPEDTGQRTLWLPAPPGDFHLSLGLYVPAKSLQNQTRLPATVKKAS